MATSKTARVQAEIDKTRLKITELQTKLRDLESRRTDIENMEIVDAVRGLGVPLENLGAILQSIKGDPALSALVAGQTSAQSMPKTSGQVDPKLATPKNIDGDADYSDTDKED